MKILKTAVIIGMVILATYLNLGPQILRAVNGEDKIAHVCFYTFLEIVFFWIFDRFSLAIVALVATLYEYLQKFSPGRNSNPYDLLASLSGAILGYYIALLMSRIFGRRSD